MTDAALQALAEALGNADGRAVLRMDEADDAILPPDGEGVLQGGPRPLRGIAHPPEAPRQSPGQLKTRPALRLGKTGHSDEQAGLSLLHGPHAETLQIPVPHEKRQVPPRPPPVPRLRPSAQVAQNLGVRVQGRVVVEVALPERPQPKAFRRQGGDFERAHPSIPLLHRAGLAWLVLQDRRGGHSGPRDGFTGNGARVTRPRREKPCFASFCSCSTSPRCIPWI